MLIASIPSWWWMMHVPAIVFIFCFGACVGSFLNVVIYRLPAGMSVINPPSRCPTCGAHLRFFRENLPILGWFMVRGRCRYCGAKVSPQYMIIEIMMALTFVGLYLLLFAITPGTPFWSRIGGAWWYYNTVRLAWPAFVIWSFLIAGLVAMTVIDARTFTIPIQIPLFVTITAFIAWPLQAILPQRSSLSQSWPIPGVGWTGLLMSVGGMAGVLISFALLKAGRLRYSFADYNPYVKEGEVLADYPHARREMMVEIVYLLPCIALMTAGWFLGRGMSGYPGHFLQAIGATFAGYLMGGGLIWAIRILGTLGFGREAMGLGDVHLLAAIGAALGWSDPIIIFFLAPFFGLLWAMFSIGLASLFRKARRELPYGPHLAAATLALILLRPAVNDGFARYMPNVPFPAPAGFCPVSKSKSVTTFGPARPAPRRGATRPATASP